MGHTHRPEHHGKNKVAPVGATDGGGKVAAGGGEASEVLGQAAPSAAGGGQDGLDALAHFQGLSAAQRHFFRTHAYAAVGVAKLTAPPTTARIAAQRIAAGELAQFQRWTAALALCSLLSGALSLGGKCDAAGLGGAGGLAVFGASCVGLAGARRLPSDIAKDLDALETDAQHLLQAFFHLAWISVSALSVPAALVTLGDSAQACSAAQGTPAVGATGAAAALVCAALAAPAMRLAWRLVTTYEMVQSMQELCCLWVIGGSTALASVTLMTSHRNVLLAAEYTVDASSQATWLVLSLTLACVSVPVATVGFAAGWSEHPMTLRLHAAAQSALALAFAAALGALAASKRHDLDSVEARCDEVLRLMGQSWFKSFFGCDKYVALAPDSLSPPVCEQVGAELGLALRKADTAVVWEAAGGGSGCMLGCVDLRCCGSVQRSLDLYSTLLIAGGLWFIVVMLAGAAASRHLERHSPPGVTVLHHRRTARMAALVAAAVCVSVGVLVALAMAGSVSTMAPLDRAAQCNYEAGPDVLKPAENGDNIVSCANGVQDGAELQVDCGGPVCPFCDSRAQQNGTSRPSHAPSTPLSAAPSPSGGSNSSEAALGLTLRWGPHPLAPADLDLKVLFMAAGGSKMCALSGFAADCGGAHHDGDGTLASGGTEHVAFSVLVKARYFVYVQNRDSARRLEDANATITVQTPGGASRFSLPPAQLWAYDLLGYGNGTSNTTGYSFARAVCFDVIAAGPPATFALYPCPLFLLDSMEQRAAVTRPGGSLPDCSLEGEVQDYVLAATATATAPQAQPRRVRSCFPPPAASGIVPAPAPAPAPAPPSPNFSDGWFVDPVVDSQQPRNCDAVCASIDPALSCEDGKMAVPSDTAFAAACQARLAQAFARYCAPQDAQYTYDAASFAPKAGSLLQLAARDGVADCVCQGGFRLRRAAPQEPPPLITLLGDPAVTVPRGSAFTDPGARCASGASATVGGQAIDTSVPRTWVRTYTCCAGPGCVATRYVVVNDPALAPAAGADRCAVGWGSATAITVTEDSDSLGGCTLSGSLVFTMNNNFQGFPNPQDEFYFGSASFVNAGACAERPSFATDRRVCYCKNGQ